MAPIIHTKYCPRCDRPFESVKSEEEALAAVKDHVAKTHPDYDVEWDDTNAPFEERRGRSMS